ncbi:glycosyltransferase [Micromonospora sp. NBC_01813]|uniref:glycosyltransferase n=1 Tax=Micromonospora sp. NBC_01813 TaxID=2975988 RepID=UPI002DD9C9FB|nr:glycosyltransferase [Micromonospora sp. NBC_01813]WSA12037.1 glycosyltransferase [Micromonospora sp. NBC_01813]
MSDLLFVTWDGGGNVPPAIGVAAELLSRGHRIRFLGHHQQAAEFESQGFAFTPYQAGRSFSSVEANSPATMISLFSTPGFGRDLLAEVARQPVDLVVIDCLLLSALRSAERAGLRHVALVHCFYEYLRGGWSRGPVGLFARLRGYRPVHSWSAADLTLVATLRELDPAARRSLPKGMLYTGPILPAPALPAPVPPARQAEEPPAILVSLSTTNFPGQPQALQAILDAVADLPARVIVTTGPAVDPDLLHAPGNAELHRFVPHDEVMPRVSLLIGHGGHATTMRALAHDLPMHPMLDQSMVGRAVQDAGAGRLVRKDARPAELRTTIAEVLADDTLRQGAQRLGRQIRDSQGAATAADALESLLRRPPAALPSAQRQDPIR